MEIYRENNPPPPGPEFQIKRLRANQEITLLVASPSIWGFWVHWVGERSEPCWKDKKRCSGCRTGKPIRWKGYLFGVDQEARTALYLEITPQAARNLSDALPGTGSFRGKLLRFRRLAGDRARMLVSQVSSQDLSDKVMADRDPYPTLAKLWGLPPKDNGLDTGNQPVFDG
jgi:hypothetical protein